MENKLLKKLPASKLDRLQPYLKKTELRCAEILSEPLEPICFAYFPTDGVVSLVNEPEDGDIFELATVGNEGMVGMPLLLGGKTTPNRAIVQVPGAALQIKASDLLMVVE